MTSIPSRTPQLRPLARSRAGFAVAVASLLALASCGTDDDGPAGSPTSEEVPAGAPVLATTTIWADVTEQVACGELEVPSIVPAGVDSHEFEPSVRDTDAVTGADLVIANGLGLEEGLTDTLDAAAEAGALVVPVAEGVTLVEAGKGEDHSHEGEGEEHSHEGEDHSHEGEGEDHSHEGAVGAEPVARNVVALDSAPGTDDHDHGHDHGGVDPHVWMDPGRVAEAVPTIADALIEAADIAVAPDRIEQCAADYVEQLDALSAELAESFSGLSAEQRRLVTDHESLAYLADAFDLEIIGTVIPSTSSLGESNPRELEELAAAMDAAGVTRIYAASSGASDVAAALGDRVGEGGEVQVVELYTESLGQPGDGADSYLSMMRVNGERISGS